jgi:hypothetical protein
LILYRVGSAAILKLRAALNLVVREPQIAVRPNVIFDNRLALLRTSRADHALKELSDCIGTRNSVRK